MKTKITNKKPTLPPRKIRVGKLDSTQEVARFQARMIKKAVRGPGEVVNDCYKLTMMASMLARTLETSDLEKRIEALEEKTNDREERSWP